MTRPDLGLSHATGFVRLVTEVLICDRRKLGIYYACRFASVNAGTAEQRRATS